MTSSDLRFLQERKGSCEDADHAEVDGDETITSMAREATEEHPLQCVREWLWSPWTVLTVRSAARRLHPGGCCSRKAR